MSARQPLLSCFTAGLLWLAAHGAVHAQQPTPAVPLLPTSPGELIEQVAIPAPQGVVVMTDGRVFSGGITEVPGGYRVDHNGTYHMVPFEYALVTAESVTQAYSKLRDSVPIHTVDSRMKLAEWCRDHQLYAEARLEIAAALKLEPLRSDARRLLTEIESATNPQPIHQRVEASPAMTADGFTKPQDRTSQGISRETMQAYIRTLQPLLLNKCGNARCHGEVSERPFTLAMNRALTNQTALSDRNLAALLQQISFDNPENSPLITKPQEASTAHKQVFRTASGARQRQILSDWIASVVQDKGVTPSEQPPRLAQHSGIVLVAAGESSSTKSTQVAQPGVDRDPQRFLDNILREERPDPFDPDRFNRLMHGLSAAELNQSAPEREDTTLEQPVERLPGINAPLLLPVN